MKNFLIALISLIGLTLVIGVRGKLHAQGAMPAKGASAVATVSLGKKVFVARCSSCHGEDASKGLPDGTSLVERLAGKDDLPAALAGRLRKLPEQEQHAVLLYVNGLVDSFRSSHSIRKASGE